MAKEPKPGDMVAFERTSCSTRIPMYKHFGIFVGDGKVVHVTSDGTPGQSTVQEASLEKVAQGGKYYVSNQDGGTRIPRDGSAIAKAARAQIGEKWEYDILSKNCETFASAVRYGDSGISVQGDNAKKTGKSFGKNLKDNLNPF